MFNLMAGWFSMVGGLLSLGSIVLAIAIYIRQNKASVKQKEMIQNILNLIVKIDLNTAQMKKPQITKKELEQIATGTCTEFFKHSPASAATIIGSPRDIPNFVDGIISTKSFVDKFKSDFFPHTT